MASDTCPTAPSSASVCAVLDGEPGAWPKFLAHWLLRSALIMPGLAIAGIRDKRLITASLISSTFVSTFLVLYTVTERGRRGMSWKRSRSSGFASQKQRALAARKQRALAARKHRALHGASTHTALVRAKATARQRHLSAR